jgi:hypothetical protein
VGVPFTPGVDLQVGKGRYPQLAREMSAQVGDHRLRDPGRVAREMSRLSQLAREMSAPCRRHKGECVVVPPEGDSKGKVARSEVFTPWVERLTGRKPANLQLSLFDPEPSDLQGNSISPINATRFKT